MLTTQSQNLDASTVESWGRQKSFFLGKKFKIIEWKQAKDLLRKGNLEGGKQYHTGWVTIYTHDDGSYLTKPPKLDALFEFFNENKIPHDGFAPE